MRKRPPKDGRLSGVRKVAVLRPNALGDFIFSLPALDSLRRAYPEAEIVLLGLAWHRDFLRDRPGAIDRVVVLPFSKAIYEDPLRSEGEAPAVRRFFREMQEERFDVAFQLYGGGRYANPVLKRLRAGLSVGLRTPDAEPLDRNVPYIYYQPEVLRCLEVVSRAGVAPSAVEPRLSLTRADIVEAVRFLGRADRPLAVLHPGASDTRRRWATEKFAAVGDALAGAGARVVVTGTLEEEGVVDRVVRTMRGNAVNGCGKLSLRGLAGLLSFAGVLVSNDTGPLHLARALGTPTAAVYWAGNVVNAGPVTVARHRFRMSWRTECPECGVSCISGRCPHGASFVDEILAEEVAGDALALFADAVSAGRSAPLRFPGP